METTTVMMPRELTAENGAKAALIGEFTINFPLACCCGGGAENCDVCGGAGEYIQPVNVPWTTIKSIYKAAVKHFSADENDLSDIKTRFDAASNTQ